MSFHLVRKVSILGCVRTHHNHHHHQLSNRFFNNNSTGTIIDPTFGLTTDEKQLQETALRFALNHFRPYMAKWDETEFFPREQLRQCGQLGFGALFTSTEDGGSGLTRLQSSVILEALAQGCVSTSALLAIHNMCTAMLSEFGNEALKARLLPDLTTLNMVASYCLTEASSGSDSASLLATAIKKGNYYERMLQNVTNFILQMAIKIT